MIWSTNFSIKRAAICLSVGFWLCGCAGGTPKTIKPIEEASPVIAVMPMENLSGFPSPLQELRESILRHLERYGLKLLPEDRLQEFMVQNRIRYLGGINRAAAIQLKTQTGAGAVLITSLELLDGSAPPRMAISARLVSTGSPPEILWMQGVALSGDENVGLLELNRIDSVEILTQKALERLVGSLADHLRGSGNGKQTLRNREFHPQVLYRTSPAPIQRPYRVAVLPFLNLSQRKQAGTIMQLQFTRILQQSADFSTVEPGVVRQALLNKRVVMNDGVSLPDSAALFGELDVDLLLSGRVFDYEDYQGETGEAKVCFSALLLEKENRQVVWSSQSCRSGNRGVWFFDRGKIRNAYLLANAMVQGAVASMRP